MLVATHYTVSLNIGKGVYVVRNKDAPMCSDVRLRSPEKEGHRSRRQASHLSDPTPALPGV